LAVLRRTLEPGAVLFVMMLASACGSAPSSALPPSSPKPVLSAADKVELTALEARPLKLPSLLPDGECRPDQIDPATDMYGSDPVFIHGGDHFSSTYGAYVDAGAYIREGMVGPVLFRGRDLKVPDHPLVFLSRYVKPPVFIAGAQLGADPLFGPQYTELVIDTSYKGPPSVVLNGGKYYDWGWRQGIGAGWSGCIGFQLDAPGFSISFNGYDPSVH
jgi:hypothetical protein